MTKEFFKLIREQDAKIDSFTILIPLTHFDSEPEEMQIPIYTMRGGGEVLEEKKPYLKHEKDGVTVRVSRKHVPKKGDFYEFVATSKMLEGDYFKGIDMTNIIMVEAYLFCLGFELKQNWLDKSIIYDLDLFVDIDLSKVNYHKTITIFKSSDLSSETKLFYDQNKKHGKVNSGMQVNTRLLSTPKKPFLKTYDKELELKTKSNDFRKKYLQDINLKDKKRIELQIKNRKHVEFLKRRFNDFENLKDLLKSQELRNKIFQSVLNTVFYSEFGHITINSTKEISDLKPQDAVMYALIRTNYDILKSKEHNFNKIFFLILEYQDFEPVQKSRLKTKLKSIFLIFLKTAEIN